MSDHPTRRVPHVLHFAPDGTGAGLHTEAIDLFRIGRLSVDRASTVEFDEESQVWEVRDFTGHRLFNHPSRRACLDWERRHFDAPLPAPANHHHPLIPHSQPSTPSQP